MIKNNVVVFPLVRKFEENLPENSSDKDKINFTNRLVSHYITEIVNKLPQHGITIDDKFLREVNLTGTFLCANILRTEGIAHALQKFIEEKTPPPPPPAPAVKKKA